MASVLRASLIRAGILVRRCVASRSAISSVHGFGGFGVGIFNANGTTVRRVVAIGNAEYGISGFGLHGVGYRIDSLARLNGRPASTSAIRRRRTR